MEKIGAVIISVGLVISILIGIIAGVFINGVNPTYDESDNPYLGYFDEIEKTDYIGLKNNPSLYGFEYAPFVDNSNVAHRVEYTSSELFGLQSYSVLGNKISYEILSGSDIVANVYLNGRKVYSGAYFNGDTLLDMAFSADNKISYMYGENGASVAALVNGGTLASHFNENGRLSSVEINGETDKSLTYFDTLLTEETAGSKKYTYSYSSSGALIYTGSDSVSAECTDTQITVSYGGSEYKYVFGYNYNGTSYVTDIFKNGELLSSYCYLNGKVAAKTEGGNEYIYVLDSFGNYVGACVNGSFYLFVFDGAGNLYSILSEHGETVAFIDSNSYGRYSVITSDDLLLGNCVIYGNSVTDTDTGFQCVAGGIVMPSCSKKISLNGTLEAICAGDLFPGTRTVNSIGKLPAMLLFEEMVIDDVITKFSSYGLSMAPYVSIKNGNGDTRMTADIYTLDYSDANGDIQNVINGNQAYKILYAGNDTLYSEAAAAFSDVFADESGIRADYYGEYATKAGSLKFNGQLIYLGYLVTYTSDGNGIIKYSFSENDPKNYRVWNNVYNYDTRAYANYAEVTFVPSLWDYTTIIPGLNTEQYSIIDTTLKDYVVNIESVAVKQTLEYIDYAYSSTEVLNGIGDTLSLFDGITEDQMLTLTSSGDITVKYLPFFDSPSTARNLIRIGTTVAAFVVVGVIACSVPGCQFLIPIVAGAAKGAVAGALGSIAYTTITTVIFEDWTQWDSFDWQTKGRDMFNSATNEFVTGAIEGVGNEIIDSIKGAAINKYVSKTKKESLIRLEADYPAFLRGDSMQAAMEYDTYKLSIYSATLFDQAGGAEYIINSRNTSLMEEVMDEIVDEAAEDFIKSKLVEREGANG